MDEFSKNYESGIFLGDFNTCISDNAMASFCSLNDLKRLIVATNMLQKSQQTKMYRFNITNRLSSYFQQNNVFETCVSDFHMTVVAELKMGFQKLKPLIIVKSFDQTFKIVPQKKVRNALKKVFLHF